MIQQESQAESPKPHFSLGLFGVVTTKIVICYHCYFFLTGQASILAACQFQFHSTQELFASFLLEPATLQLMFVTEMDRSKESEPQEGGSRAVLIGTKGN